MPPFAAAFDLDGTLIDNNVYHILAWQEFYRKRNRILNIEDYKENFNGRTMPDVVRYVFQQKGMSKEDIDRYTDEKESLYRELYSPHIAPIKGLLPLLDELHQHNIPMVIATSGIEVNIEFMFSHIPIRKYFKKVIKGNDITHGKPDPEIYQLAARELGLPPQQCIAFEDAIVGIRSAKDAGMQVVALTTTHTQEELAGADKVVKNFEGIDIDWLAALV
jgi:HAD superfamily hydrolase (TIGR01509 family)